MVTTGLSGATICVGARDAGAVVAAGLAGGTGDALDGAGCGGAVSGADTTPGAGCGAPGAGEAGFAAVDGALDEPFAPLAMVVTGEGPDPGTGAVARPTGADTGSDAGADVPRPMDAIDAASRANARNPR